MLWLVSSNPAIRSRHSPTLAATDREIDDYVKNWVEHNDANDQLYALEASEDYDPGPGLEKITAPLIAVNSADDLVNPPEIGVLEKEITRVPHGRAVMIPFSDKTAGHGTHTLAAVWKNYLVELLQESQR
jgi:homoserine O-acetyltransferase